MKRLVKRGWRDAYDSSWHFQIEDGDKILWYGPSNDHQAIITGNTQWLREIVKNACEKYGVVVDLDSGSFSNWGYDEINN